MFSRCFARPNGAKSKYIFEIREEKQVLRWSAACLLGCPLGAGGQGTLAILLASAKMDKIPSFCPLCCFVLGALLANMALLRVLRGFLEGFPCWMYVCIALMLCVACVAFVCVRG